jgi:hypothetical protein
MIARKHQMVPYNCTRSVCAAMACQFISVPVLIHKQARLSPSPVLQARDHMPLNPDNGSVLLDPMPPLAARINKLA